MGDRWTGAPLVLRLPRPAVRPSGCPPDGCGATPRRCTIRNARCPGLDGIAAVARAARGTRVDAPVARGAPGSDAAADRRLAHAPARAGVRARAAAAAEPGGRRGPGAGGVPRRLPRVRHVSAGHQLQSLVLPDPHQLLLRSSPTPAS